MDKSIYNSAEFELQKKDYDKVSSIITIYVNNEVPSVEDVKKLFKRAREVKKEYGNFSPCYIMYYYWAALPKDIKKDTVYSFYWILYDLLVQTLSTEIPIDLYCSYIQTIIECNSFLNNTNDYVLNWYFQIQRIVLGKDTSCLPPALLEKFISIIPIDHLSKEHQQNNSLPSPFEYCSANFARAYITLEKYDLADRVINKAIAQRPSWQLLQIKASIQYAKENDTAALYCLFSSLLRFDSPWKFGVKLFKESSTLLAEYNMAELSNKGLSIYHTICTKEGWNSSIEATIESDLEEAISQYISDYKNAVLSLCKNMISHGTINRCPSSNSLGLITEHKTEKRFNCSLESLHNLNIHPNDDVLFVWFNLPGKILNQVDVVLQILPSQPKTPSSEQSNKIATNHPITLLPKVKKQQLKPAVSSKPQAAATKYDGLTKTTCICSQCGKTISVKKRTIQRRGLGHVLCTTCYFNNPHDPYYGLDAILSSIRDDHSMFNMSPIKHK